MRTYYTDQAGRKAFPTRGHGSAGAPPGGQRVIHRAGGYPVDADGLVERAKQELGVSLPACAEGSVRAAAAAVNQAYEAGRLGLPGFPVDPEATVERLRQQAGPETGYDILACGIRWINAAYRQGRRAAEFGP